MNEVFGIWNEEIDLLCENDLNALVLNVGSEYEVKRLRATVYAKTAKVPSGVTSHTRVGDNGEKLIFVESSAEMLWIYRLIRFIMT